MRGRATGVVLPALAVLALIALVAIAATGSTPGGDGSTRPPSEALLDGVFTLGLIAVLIGAVLLVYGLMQRKAIAHEMASGRHRRTSVVAFVVFFAIFTAYSYWRLNAWTGPEESPDGDQELAFPGRPNLPTLPPEAETSYEPSISWLPLLVVAGLATTAVVAYVVAERRARGGRGRGEALAEQLAAALDETLDDLRAEQDPRRAIIAAYARLERVLAAHGLPRRPAEAPLEYLGRMLADVSVSDRAARALTDRFERAKFSQHAVGTEMKEQAIDALETVRDDLLAARALAEQARQASLAAQREQAART